VNKQVKIDKLVAWLEKQDYRYHTLIKPRYSDDEYDEKKDQLRKLASNHKYLLKVGAPIAPGRVKIKFDVFVVGSLEKKRPTEAKVWWQSLKQKLGNNTMFYILPKLDGISLTLHYKNGKLLAAFKRGEGDEGEDCIINARYIQGVLPTLKPSNMWSYKGDVYIRGEVICHNKIFDAKFSKKSGNRFSTARNFVGGMLNTLPDKKTKELPAETINGLQNCTFVCFAMTHINDKSTVVYAHKSNVIAAFHMWGLTAIDNPSRYNKKSHKWFEKRDYFDWTRYVPVIKTDNTVPNWLVPFDASLDEEFFLAKMAEYREAVDIDQDGLVLEIGEHNAINSLGYQPNGKTPKFMVAVKPERKDQLTLSGEVKLIELSFSSRRIYTPVVILKKPLDFKGVKVSRITGHNVGNLVRTGIDVGSKVDIIRSGDVIPFLHGLTKGQKSVAQPSWLIRNCLFCKTKLQYSKDKKTGEKVQLFCPNKKCSGFGFETLDRFFSKFKIDGLSRGTLTNLAKQGIDTVPKVLRVTPKQLAKVEGFAQKKAENLLAGIKKITASADLAVIAGASGIFANEKHGLDKELLGPIITKFGKPTFLAISDVKLIRSKLLGVPNMGAARMQLFIEKLPEFQKFYAEISDLITLDTSQANLLSVKFAGKNFVFTEFRSAELENYIKSNGGKVGSSVSGKTTAVFYGKPGSNKYNDAVNKNIPVIAADKAENFLMKM
jgi:DNA ligase (NAD+)